MDPLRSSSELMFCFGEDVKQASGITTVESATCEAQSRFHFFPWTF